MLIGLGCFKTGVFTGQASTRTYVVLTVIGLLALAGTGALLTGVVVNGLARKWLQATEAFQLASAPLTTLAYVSLMVFAARATGLWSAIPRVLAPVGQMAFTNYLTQSLIMTAIFYGGRSPGRRRSPPLAVQIIALLLELHGKLGVTLVLVTHDLSVAERASRIIRMKDGRVVSDQVSATF